MVVALSSLQVDTIVIIVCCHRMLNVGQNARPTDDSNLNQANSIDKANTSAKCNTSKSIVGNAILCANGLPSRPMSVSLR